MLELLQSPSHSSVVCTECIVAKRCVLEQKLLLTASMRSYTYEKWYQINFLEAAVKLLKSRWWNFHRSSPPK